MNSAVPVYAYDFDGDRYDVGEKLGFVKTTIEYALKDPKMKDELLTFIKHLGFIIKVPKTLKNKWLFFNLLRHFNLIKTKPKTGHTLFSAKACPD